MPCTTVLQVGGAMQMRQNFLDDWHLKDSRWQQNKFADCFQYFIKLDHSFGKMPDKYH